MKSANILIIMASFIVFASPAKAVEDFTKQHAYVMGSGSESRGGRLDFFNNGDTLRWAAGYDIWDRDLRANKAQVRTQYPHAGQTYGVVIRYAGTEQYVNSIGDKNNNSIVQPPGFWAFYLNFNKVLRIADAMYTFSYAGDDAACRKEYEERNAGVISIRYLFYNKDDTAARPHEFFPWYPTAKLTTNFNYNGGTYNTSDIKIKAHVVRTTYGGNEAPIDSYNVQRSDGSSAVTPGTYVIKCDPVSKKIKFDKEQPYRW